MEAQSIGVIPVGQAGSIPVCTLLDMEVVPASWVHFQPHECPSGSDVSLFVDEKSSFWSCVQTFEKESEIVNFMLQS